MEDLSFEEIVRKILRYKFSKKTTMGKIAQEIEWSPSHLCKVLKGKKQLSFITKEKLIWFLKKKEQENGEVY